MKIAEQIVGLRDGGAAEAEAIPPGRFFGTGERVQVQRYRLSPGFLMFEGHFPGKPILPALAHVLLARDAAEAMSGRPLLIAEIDQAKFLSMVGPGAVLDIFMASPRAEGGAWLFQVMSRGAGEDGFVEAARIKMALK